MNEEKNKCPLCHTIHNEISNDYININNQKEKNILCASCINKFPKDENNLSFRNGLNLNDNRITELEEETEIDNTVNRKTENNLIVKHELNKSIIEEIKRDSFNKTLIQGIKRQINQKHIISNIQSQNSSLNNNMNNSYSNSITHKKINKNIKSGENYYIKKTVKVNTPSCNVHFLPMNMICVNDNVKLCSKCSLDKSHCNHEIINEKDFIGYINELNIIYDTIDKNKKIYNNFNQKFYKIIENINDKFIKMENQIVEIKKDILKKINQYFIDLLNFINLRRKEIFDKYQYCNYDISDLIKSSSSWMKKVKENKEEINIINLINSGKQLNDRYNIVKEINNIFKVLEAFKDNGMFIIKNEFSLNPVIIKENKGIIQLLNLTPYEEQSNIQNNNNNNKNNISENSEQKYNSTNPENVKIYCKKLIEDRIKHNHTATDFYQNINQIQLKTIKSEKHIKLSNMKNKIMDINRISLSKINNDINNISQSNESPSPFLNSINAKNNINSSQKDKNKNKNTITEYKNKCESIQVNNETDNNININFNGHIFNYNSDNNISIIIPEKNKDKNKNIVKKKEIKKIKNTNKIKHKRNTPQKISIRKKIEKQNLKRCFSFDENENTDSNKKTDIKNKLCLSNNSKILNEFNYEINDNNISQTSQKESKRNTKNEKAFVIKGKIKTNKYNINYKTLNNKDLEKYVEYQLKKLKQNFNRINLRDYGIKLICFFYKNNKNKVYKEIKLQGCNLNDNDIKLLIKCIIEFNIKINSINISDNELTDESIESIINLTNNNNEITNLIIKNNLFSKQGKKNIKESVKNRKESLFELNLEL